MIRVPTYWLLSIILGLLLVSCSSSDNGSPSTVVPTNQPVATSEPASVSAPTATPLPPTATPVPPAPTPVPPTATPVPTGTSVPTATPIPTATSAPTATPVPEGTPVPKELSFTIELAEPYSGRDALFTLQGLDLWEKVAVQLFDPNRQPAEWVSKYESYLTDVNGNPVTKRSLYADDQAGIWKVQITRGDTATNMAYSVIRLPVTPTGSKTIGVDFRLYQG